MTREEAHKLLNDPRVHPEAKERIRQTLTERSYAASSSPGTGRGGVLALAAARTPGVMTKTETLYSLRLNADLSVLAWDYESDRIKLADKIDGGKAKWFKVDFTVHHADGRVSWDEVKGGWITDAGMERFRALCARYPRRWIRMWQYKGGKWALKLESGNTPVAAKGAA
jgi:hypothetical protein